MLLAFNFFFLSNDCLTFTPLIHPISHNPKNMNICLKNVNILSTLKWCELIFFLFVTPPLKDKAFAIVYTLYAPPLKDMAFAIVYTLYAFTKIWLPL